MSKRRQKTTGPLANPFREAVEGTSDIRTCYAPGLQALGAHSVKVRPGDTRLCEGSVDLDDCTKARYPDAPRWDYIVGYQGRAYFVEVHPAHSSAVSEVIKKLDWLRKWLDVQAPEIKALKAAEQPFIWLQTKGMHLPKGTTQYRTAAEHGILPVAVVKLG